MSPTPIGRATPYGGASPRVPPRQRPRSLIMQKMDDDYNSAATNLSRRNSDTQNQLEQGSRDVQNDLTDGLAAAKSVGRRASKYDIY